MLINLLSISAFAATPANLAWVVSLRTVAFALAWLMMVLMGVKWIVADSPNERAEAKKGMIYIVIGLLIVVSARPLLQMYCNTIGLTKITVDCSFANSLP
jgi:uncharacterized membrane protein